MTRYLFAPILIGILLVEAIATAEPPKVSEETRKAVRTGGPKEIPLSGKVTELLTSGGYTYVKLAGNGDPVWAAFPTIPLKPGQELVLVPGYEMKNFTSKTLNRTFERVVFSAGPVEKQSLDPNLVKEAHKGRSAQPPESEAKQKEKSLVSPVAPLPMISPSPVTTHSSPLPVNSGDKVQKAGGSNAYTVRQLYDRRGELDKKKVVIRGRVIKVNLGILKRSWVHLQDGTGKPGMEDCRLVTTTPSANKNLPKVGDIVTATGTLRNNADFGGGYRYYVVLEDSRYRKDPRTKR